jgi:mevalonate kinase
MIMKRFRAYGKLLLSAEYMVLFGAEALALPLKPGQELTVGRSEDPESLSWTAMESGRTWFHAVLDTPSLRIRETSDRGTAEHLRTLLNACLEMNPGFAREISSAEVHTTLDFPPEYGLGSSSTLISLLASWAGCDPMELHFRVSEGSGYDVACARSVGPVLYRLFDGRPVITPAGFNPPFRDRLWFAWLGNKQPTATHLRQVAGKLDPGPEQVRQFSRFTREMLGSADLDTFRRVMEEHERVLSGLLGTPTLSARFPLLPGTVKSLGAWGGDFILIAGPENRKELSLKLEQNGITVVYSYDELVYEGN